MAHINYPPAVAATIKDFKEELAALEFEVSSLYDLAPVGFMSDVIECMAERVGSMAGDIRLENERAHFLPKGLEGMSRDLSLMASTLEHYGEATDPKTKPAFEALAGSLAEKGLRAGYLSDTMLDHED